MKPHSALRGSECANKHHRGWRNCIKLFNNHHQVILSHDTPPKHSRSRALSRAFNTNLNLIVKFKGRLRLISHNLNRTIIFFFIVELLGIGNMYVAIILSTIATFVVLSQSFYLDKRVSNSDFLERNRMDPKKRPFCNAFTGCGRKRSNLPPLPSLIERDPPELENLGTLLDLSAEPAVEDLSRQIMSEAKLWEAIQEAHREIMRQRQEISDGEELPPANPLAGATSGVGVANGKCALPSCIAI